MIYIYRMPTFQGESHPPQAEGRARYAKAPYFSKKKRDRNFRMKVQRIINGQTERKKYVVSGVNTSITTASGGGTPTALNCLPALALGTNQEARVGEQVKITKATVRGFVNLLPYSAITNPGTSPIKLKMWLVSSKISNSITLSTTNVGTGFFEIGSDTTGFNGNMQDMMLPVNKQAWTVHARRTYNLGVTSAGTSINSATLYDNSRMSLPFSISYGKHFKKPLKYSDDSSALNSNYPISRNCWLFFQPVYADGTSASGYTIAEYHYTLDVSYTDM